MKEEIFLTWFKVASSLTKEHTHQNYAFEGEKSDAKCDFETHDSVLHATLSWLYEDDKDLIFCP